MGQLVSLICDGCKKTVPYTREDAGEWQSVQSSLLFPPETAVPQGMAGAGQAVYQHPEVPAVASVVCSKKCATKCEGEAWDKLKAEA